MADFKISLVEPETTQITQSSEIHATVGGTSNYPALNNKPQINGVELVGDKTSEELGLVGNKDYASVDKAGLVKMSTSYGTYVNQDTGVLSLVSATESVIEQKKDNYRPLVSKYLDLAVKTGVTTNTIELTEEEKISAQTWLGVENKLNRSTEGGFRIYADANGKDTLLAYTDSSVGNTIPIRRDNNNFQVGTPKKGGECANKNYVDDIASSLAGQNEYIGSFQGSDYTAETIQSVLTTFVELNTNPSRTARNGDIINIVNGIYGGQQWIYNGNEAVWKYYIDFQNHSVINNLESESTVDGLAAKQGKQLKSEIDDINTNLTENYVKNTDYATASKVGLIYANANYGVRMEDGGSLRTYPAGENDIDTRHFYRPITPNKLDYAVKTGLTTNTIELTDAEKAAAQEWLGVDSKLDKNSTSGQGYGVYAFDNDGNQTTVRYTSGATSNTLALRTTNGRVEVGDAVNEKDAANKKYVDEKISELESKIPTSTATQLEDGSYSITF